ncbi:EscU/YscU/HrcU family type III secretion system export apparatus switch protein [Sporanaerobacter sp. PP17-6a]|uniref:EscU/YscU/HrcU family type III secretion system export apparatus switch protein n=1 Tax=Sporanaerobacter sp. PP17-6a TaxID=1891289 RepID=UPI0008A090F0|nr:EscU/YscU/HrcU family type III secretion system export apparatus switch protein [Sporanaerobacter sp. PP17-6a]SCL83222.1 Flagellar biosynthetic protein FlhB [Sporanaerobacter sp. PP17-6a]
MKEKRKSAVALKYNKDNSAPIVVAKGRGHIAEKIIEIAKENKVEIYEDEDVADNLMKLEMGMEIPQELYEAVAEIIAYIYNLNMYRGESHE